MLKGNVTGEIDLQKFKENQEEGIDNKFEALYERIQTMAIDQANFNSSIQQKVDRLGIPIQKQVETMMKENDLIHTELERSQNHNRELLSS